MAFVPGHEPDIFISYAQIDDQPASDIGKGWVTTLVEGLQSQLDLKLGRGAYSLRLNGQTMPATVEVLPKAAAWVIILSKGYLGLNGGINSKEEDLKRRRVLHQLLSQRFNDEELNNLCFYLGLDQDNFPKEKDPKAQELIKYFENRKRIPDLTEAILQVRPDISSKDLAGVREEIPTEIRDSFVKRIETRIRVGLKVFIMDRDRLIEKVLPSGYKGMKSYLFLEEQTRELGYFQVLTDLNRDLVEELQRLKDSVGKSHIEVLASDSRPAVLLAEVTDDLAEKYDNVRRYLDQMELRVLPEDVYKYPREPVAFQQALSDDLARCAVFVQLLSPFVGKRPSGLSKGYARLQYECAAKLGKSILQWCDPGLDLKTVRDMDHRMLLEGETVLAVGIEEFKRTVVEKTFPKLTAKPSKPVGALVFINEEPIDSPLASKIREALEKYGVGFSLAKWNGEPMVIRRDLEQNLLYCDGMIVIYGIATATWVREQLLYCRKMLQQRGHPLQALAVYEGPPEPKDPLDFKLPFMDILNGRTGFDEVILQAFIRKLGGGNAL